MVSQHQILKGALAFAIVTTLFLDVQSLLRGYREACGTHLHAGSRDTVAEGRQCDKSKGLACTRFGVCDCTSYNVRGKTEQMVWNKTEQMVWNKTEQMVWNKTHCVVKLNSTCLIKHNTVPELFFLPNSNRTEELLCGRDANCTDNGCVCDEEYHADVSHLNCIIDTSGQSTLAASHIALIVGTFYATLVIL